MDIQAPLTLFVDEAGASDFGNPQPGARRKSHVVVAVAVPTIAFPGLLRILPKNEAGKLLKSSCRDFHPGLAMPFVQRLIQSQVDVGAFMVNTGDHDNIQLAADRARIANERRKAAREEEASTGGKAEHPDIRPHDLHYLSFLPRAVFACLEIHTVRSMGRMPSFVDFVIDSKQIDEFQKQRFVSEMRRICDEQGLRIGRFDWRKEEAEPLLLLPDLFGGILCREERFRDEPAARLLWDAEGDGRFQFDNKPPPQSESVR